MSQSVEPDDGRPALTAVVAMATNGVIGREGDMPWKLSSDLRRFKRLTMGGVLIMGRKTFDSIGRLLPGRQTIVITRDPQWSADGVFRVGSPDEAISLLAELAHQTISSSDISQSERERQGNLQGFVVGGAEIYRQLMNCCQRLLLTRVLAEVEGDTFLELDLSGFEQVSSEQLPASGRDEYPTEFVVLQRIDP